MLAGNGLGFHAVIGHGITLSRRAKISERTTLTVLTVRCFPECRLEFCSVMAHTELLGQRAQQCRVMVCKLLSAGLTAMVGQELQ
jgi:hypothetical protein